MFWQENRISIRQFLTILAAIGLFSSIAPKASAQTTADFALGGHNICAIDTDGRLECTTLFNARTYLPLDDGTLYTEVASGDAHSCAITQAGDIRCWGLNNFGQSNNIPTSPVPFTSLSAGANHTCALDMNGEAFCWGLNTNGQTDVPIDNSEFASIHAGALGTCGLTATGNAECWGNDFVYTSTFIQRNSWTDFVFPSEGGFSPACGLTTGGFIECWSTSQDLPIPNNGPYTQIETGGIFLCGLPPSGNVDCTVRTFNNVTPTNNINLSTLAAINALPPLVDFEVHSSGPSSGSFCGIDEEGTLICVGNGLPADSLPGEPLAIPQPFNLDFTIYSESAGELFWETDLTSFRSPVIGFNVYRNNELVSFTTGNGSYFDDSLAPNTSYTYEVAMVLLDGSEGLRSEPFTALAGGAQTPPGNTNDAPDYLLSNIELSRYSGSTLELFWDRPTSGGAISHYDVFRNGEYLATTPGPSFFDNTVQSCNTYEYTIAAVLPNDQIAALGFQSEGPFPTTTCP